VSATRSHTSWKGATIAILETEALTRRFGALTAVDALTTSVDGVLTG
jgi:hypothetical protein